MSSHEQDRQTTNPEPAEHELKPHDAFEQAWMGKLAETEADLSRSGEAFVQSVMQRRSGSQGVAGVIGRIGFSTRGAVAAAAVLGLAVCGWYLLSLGDTNNTAPTGLAGNDNGAANAVEKDQPDIEPALQPDVPSAVVKVDADNIPLGQMITRTRSNMSGPASKLAAVVNQAPQVLNVERLMDLLEPPVPDLKQLLSPKKKDTQQSSA